MIVRHTTAALAVGLGLVLCAGCKNPTVNAPPPKPSIEDALGLWAIDTYLLDDQGCSPQEANAPMAGIEVRRTSGEDPAADAPTLELAHCESFESCTEITRPEDRLQWLDDESLARARHTYASPTTRGELESWCRVGRVDAELQLDGPSARHTRQRYETLIALEGDLECAPALADDLGDDTPCVTSEVFELVPYEPIPAANPASADETAEN